MTIFLTLVLITFSPLLGFALFTFFRVKYFQIIEVKHKNSQRLMFNQLKKGDVIWEVEKANIIGCIVKDVDYVFDYKNNLSKIKISFKNLPFVTLNVRAEEAKSFRYLNYYTLYGEAKAVHNFNVAKQKNELNKIKSVSFEDIKKASDEVIKNLDSLKKSFSKEIENTVK